MKCKPAIKISDITSRHPGNLVCKTDPEYAEFANKLYDNLYEYLHSFGENVMVNVAVSLALYFEDIKSETHQFEVFTKLYKEWFGLYVPFHASEDENSPTAELDAANFILWHAIVAEREERIVNPLNDGIRDAAKKVLDIWNEEKENIPVNDTLGCFLYCEETQDNPVLVRDILAWIEGRSFLGRWYTNVNRIKEDEHDVKSFFKNANERDRRYEIECLDAFAHQAWPLSLPAKHIYAEMIRIDMDDPDDENAAYIDKMESEPLSFFRVDSVGRLEYILKDFKGQKFNVPYNTKQDPKTIKDNNTILCGLYYYRGHWYPNGLSCWTKLSDNKYSNYAESMKKDYVLLHNHTNLLDDVVKKNGGEPIFFFKNLKEYSKMVKKEFGITDIRMEDVTIFGGPVTGFVEYNGQMSISQTARIIKHPRNPYYDLKSIGEESLLIFQKHSMSPGLAIYLLEHELVPDIAFSDMRGEEHGRLLLHENIDFLVRCCRRDITSTEIFHKRNKNLFASDIDPRRAITGDEMSIEYFMKQIIGLDYFYSSTNKEWKMIACNITLTTLLDVARSEVYDIPTKNLYDAFLEHGYRGRVADMVPFVGRKNASAACALLYNIDDGVTFEDFNNLISQLIKRNFK